MDELNFVSLSFMNKQFCSAKMISHFLFRHNFQWPVDTKSKYQPTYNSYSYEQSRDLYSSNTNWQKKCYHSCLLGSRIVGEQNGWKVCRQKVVCLCERDMCLVWNTHEWPKISHWLFQLVLRYEVTYENLFLTENTRGILT